MRKAPLWIVNVYGQSGRFVGPLMRPCNGKNRPIGLEWKIVVYRSFKRALIDANLRTVECSKHEHKLMHNVVLAECPKPAFAALDRRVQQF